MWDLDNSKPMRTRELLRKLTRDLYLVYEINYEQGTVKFKSPG